MDSVDERMPLVEGKISKTIRVSYALGHVFNDLAAAMWFSYTLLYLQRIILFEPVTAGAMLLLGQIVDALMTPVFGILVDRYGSKKSWHVLGSILVGISFPAIFGTFVDIVNPSAIFVYIVSISIFQTGWAAVQISHLSMIPALATSPLARADLTAIRRTLWLHVIGSVFTEEALVVGARFTSFKDLESALTKFEEQTYTKLWKRDSRTIGASRISRKIDENLIYYEIKYTCIHGGKRFQSSGKGLREVRYSAQVGAAVTVFVVTWIILPTQGDSVVQVTMSDADKFRKIVIICTVIGITTTVFFHVFLKARHLEALSPTSSKDCDDVPSRNVPITGRKNWSGTTLLLRVALLYVASRLFITLAMVYLPLYIEESAVGGKQALATVPLASYLASFVAALCLKHINKSCGTKVCYLIGALTGILSCIITEFSASNTAVVYIVAILIGGGSSITMVTSLSVTAELIGPRTERSALVYSVVTFLDKVVTGLVVILIEKLRCLDKQLCPTYYRDTLSIVCASSMLLGLLALASVARCLT